MSIEGQWGSGKSSFVNFLADELSTHPDHAPSIVRFEPWLVGDRDGMLGELMAALASAIELIAASCPEASTEARLEAKQLANNMLGYARKLSRHLAPAARLAGILGVPGAELASKGFKAASETVDSLETPKPLPEAKQELTEGLSALDRRIIVVIDDLDRLEPQEASEITRLLRAVADFPNVIYILCYDPAVLACNLERINIKQKIYSVCDIEGTILQTPRDVIRTVNAIKLCWRPLIDLVDYADLVWLQILRIKNEPLYSWIERYLVEYGVAVEGASIPQAQKSSMASDLRQHLAAAGVFAGDPRSMYRLQQFIPGIRLGRDDKDLLFNDERQEKVALSERYRRLSSPQHSRYYFAFTPAEGALADSELDNFISSAEGGANLEEISKALVKQVRPQGGTKFDLLIDRLNRLDDDSLPYAAIAPIIIALANCMDMVSTGGRWGVRWSWQSGERLFKKLATRLKDEDRRKVIQDVFGQGTSIGWLMSELVRDELRAHGRVGERAQPEEERLLSESELTYAITLLHDRFKSTDRDHLLNAPDLLSLMYGWMESGDEDGVLQWVGEQEGTDQKFLALLSACRGWMQSDKVYHPLNRRDLKKFLDFDGALARLSRIADDLSITLDERCLAKELLAAAEIGKDD